MIDQHQVTQVIPVPGFQYRNRLPVAVTLLPVLGGDIQALMKLPAPGQRMDSIAESRVKYPLVGHV